MSKVNMDKVIEAAPQNPLIQNTMMKMDMKLTYYRNPVCSISGGSDSDIMMDIIERVRGNRPVTYVFFDTGIEYAATKRHLDDLETKYGIEIVRRKAVVPVPRGCREYGLPFLSKQVSEFIDRLQKHRFQWENEPFEALIERYPGCQSALRWWCNAKCEDSSYNINSLAYLKEFMIKNPPPIKISNKCCNGAKKSTSHLLDVEFDPGMKILGLRRAEGGVRATTFTSCFDCDDDKKIANYRPLWFWSDADKDEYKAHYGVTYSDCYEVYGMTRTGCAGCPFNSRFEDALKVVAQYEPQLYKAANKIFGAAYEYTRAYREYRDKRKAEEKLHGQTVLEGAG